MLKLIKNKCCINIKISVFFIYILNQLNWQWTNFDQSLYSLSRLQSAKQYHWLRCFYQAKCHTSQKITCPPFRPHWCENKPQSKMQFGGEQNVKQKMTSWACMQHEPWEKTSCLRKTKMRREKAVISHYKWIGVECPKNLKSWKGLKNHALHRPSLTGGGPSGAGRRVAGHNTGEVLVLRLSVTRRSSQHPPLGPNKKIKPTLNSQLRSYVNRGQGLSLSKCFVYPICIVLPHFSSQQVSQTVGYPSFQPASRPLQLAQQAIAVRVR